MNLRTYLDFYNEYFIAKYNLNKDIENENEILKELKIIPKICNKLIEINKKETISSNSKSDSEKLIIKLENNKVFVKIFLNLPLEQSGLVYEGLIYKNIIKSLLENNNTPYLVKPIEYTICPELLTYINRDNKNPSLITNKLWESLYNNYLILSKVQKMKDIVHVIINEQIKDGSETVEKFIQNEKTTIEDLKIFAFQLIWDLQTFQSISLRHNDLHLENMYIEKGEKGDNGFYYFELNIGIKTIYFKISRKINLKIFDFDRSVIYNILDNEYLRTGSCPTFGICNERNPGYDASIVGCRIFNKTSIDLLDDDVEFQEFLFIMDKLSNYRSGITLDRNLEYVQHDEKNCYLSDKSNEDSLTNFLRERLNDEGMEEKEQKDFLEIMKKKMIYSQKTGQRLLLNENVLKDILQMDYFKSFIIRKEEFDKSDKKDRFHLPNKDEIKNMHDLLLKDYKNLINIIQDR
jgi:hypothetical protein